MNANVNDVIENFDPELVDVSFNDFVTMADEFKARQEFEEFLLQEESCK